MKANILTRALAVMVAGALISGCGEPATSPEPPGALPCVKEAGCSWARQSEESARAGQRAIEHLFRELEGIHARDEREHEAIYTRVLEEVVAIPGIARAERASGAVFITTNEGYVHLVRVHEGFTHRANEALLNPPPNIEETVRGGQSMVRQPLISRSSAPLEGEKKRARLIAAWNWQFEEDMGELEEILVGVRDYDHALGVEVFDFDSPWPADAKDMATRLDAFRGWSTHDLIYVSAHGDTSGADFRIDTGIVIGIQETEDSDTIGYNCLTLRQVASMEFGIGCSGMIGGDVTRGDGSDDAVYGVYTLTISPYWLAAQGSSLVNSRALAIFSACKILGRRDFEGFGSLFVGEESVLFAPDETVSAQQGVEAAFLEQLVTQGFSSREAYARVDKDLLTAIDPPGVYRLFPATSTLRIAEAITLIEPGEDERLEDGHSVPVMLDDLGKPRMLELDIEYAGVIEAPRDELIHGERFVSEREDMPGIWLTDVNELDGPDGEPIRQLLGGQRDPFDEEKLVRLEDGGFRLPVKLLFERDLLTREEVHIRATITLPEGGVSTHTVTIAPEPIELAWSARAEGDVYFDVSEQYAHAGYEDFTDQLLVYLTDSQESFLGMNGPLDIRLVLKGIEPGEVGVFDAPGEVLIDIDIPTQDIKNCPLLMPRVELERFDDARRVSGTFSGTAFCKNGQGPEFTLNGAFVIWLRERFDDVRVTLARALVGEDEEISQRLRVSLLVNAQGRLQVILTLDVHERERPHVGDEQRQVRHQPRRALVPIHEGLQIGQDQQQK